MTRLVILTLTRCAPAALAVFLAASPVAAKCLMSYCQDDAPETTRRNITDPDRRIVGDLYAPKGSRRIQIRDNHRRILGYVERDGKITDTRRRKVGSIEALN